MTRFSICYLEDGQLSKRHPLDPAVTYIGRAPEGMTKTNPYERNGECIFVENIHTLAWNQGEVIIYVSK